MSSVPAEPGAVRRVLVLANFGKPAVRELVSELEPWLAERVQEVELATDVPRFLEEYGVQSPERQRQRPELVVVLGGDGTLLSAVRAFASDPIPTVGINLGRVGFLAATPATRWRETLESVLAGEGILEPRMRLAVEWETRSGIVRSLALNELVLQRGSHHGMLAATISVDGDRLTDYRADGLIVATPSGSTAYSLSAGGPIIAPSVEAILVTPICSQGLSTRPIVLHPDSHIRLWLTQSSGISTLAIDGQAYHSLSRGQEVSIQRDPVPYPLYAMPGLDPYRRLRNRLGWRGSVERQE